MALIVPLKPVASQTLSISLDGQAAQISVYQLTTGLFMDLMFNGIAVITARICRNAALLIHQSYSGFLGDFTFIDTQPDPSGGEDPSYAGLGVRFQLLYLDPVDFA